MSCLLAADDEDAPVSKAAHGDAEAAQPALRDSSDEEDHAVLVARRKKDKKGKKGRKEAISKGRIADDIGSNTVVKEDEPAATGADDENGDAGGSEGVLAWMQP